MPKHYLKNVLTFLILVVVYAISAKIGLFLAFEQVNTSPVWPPTGVAIACVLIFGFRIWPAIFLGSLWVNLDISSSFSVASSIAVGNTLEAIVAVYIILHFASAKPFSKISETVVFILALFFATMISASVGVGSLYIADIIPLKDTSLLWGTWWIGNLVGGLVVAPFILAWAHWPKEPFTKRQSIEGIILFLLTISIVSIVFGPWQLLGSPEELMFFSLLPVIAWSALRFHHYGTTLILMIIATAAIVGTLHNNGPFVLETPNESLLTLQAYVGAAMFTALLLMAAQEESLRAFRALRLSEKHLEAKVAVRTQELEESNELLEKETYQQKHLTDSLTTLLYEVDRSSDEDFFARCTQSMAQIFKAKFAFVGVFSGDNKASIKTLAVCSNGKQKDNFTYSLKGSPCETVLGTGMEFIPEQVSKQYPDDDLLVEMGVEGYFGAALVSTSGDVLGILVILDVKPLSVDEALKTVLGLFSNRVSFELQRRMDTEELELAASVFKESLEAIMICDSQSNIIRVNPEFTNITGYSLEEVVGKRPNLWASGKQSKEFYQSLWDDLTNDGFWQGELVNKRKDGTLYNSWQVIKAVKDENGNVQQFISISNDITDKKKDEEKIYQLAHYDLITKLPNRVSFQKVLKKSIFDAAHSTHRLAVMFIDLDHFKFINDTSGHPVGDELLQEVAARFKSVIGDKNTISRFGGDEFTVMLPNIESVEEVSDVATRILESLLVPITLSSCEITISASIGISIYPDNGQDASTLLSCADNAMYRAKESGRASFQFYTDQMQVDAQERVALERELRVALKESQFILHYQPQIDIHSHSVIGMEALIRWKHPNKGLIPPDKFIPIAETTGLIVPIGEWVIDEACRQLQLWSTAGFDNLTMAINLSARQLFQNDLLEVIESSIHKYNIEASKLEFEITESMMMLNIEEIIDTLNMIKALGVQLSIDDFGTGYSSLSYLKRFPLNKLKIDKSFIDGLPDDKDDFAIVQSIIAIGHALKLTVIAEGVETIEQYEALENNQCNEIQGYYFSKPLAVSAASQFLTEFSKQS